MPASRAKAACADSSLPRSQVVVLRSCSGSVVIEAARAWFIATAPQPPSEVPFLTGGCSPHPASRGEAHQDRGAAVTLDKGADRRATGADDQVPFPVPGNSAVVGLGGAFADHDIGGDVALRSVPRPWAIRHAIATEATGAAWRP